MPSSRPPWKPPLDENGDPRWEELPALLSVSEVAAIFNAKEDSVRKWRDRGQLVGHRVVGSLRFKKADVRELYEESFSKAV